MQEEDESIWLYYRGDDSEMNGIGVLRAEHWKGWFGCLGRLTGCLGSEAGLTRGAAWSSVSPGGTNALGLDRLVATVPFAQQDGGE